jgi:hypothetical protein
MYGGDLTGLVFVSRMLYSNRWVRPKRVVRTSGKRAVTSRKRRWCSPARWDRSGPIPDDCCSSITAWKQKLEHETEWNDTFEFGAKRKWKQQSLILRTSPVYTKKSVPKIKGTAKSGETRKGNTHENPLILTFRCTSPNTSKGWRDAVTTRNETGAITRLGLLSLSRWKDSAESADFTEPESRSATMCRVPTWTSAGGNLDVGLPTIRRENKGLARTCTFFCRQVEDAGGLWVEVDLETRCHLKQFRRRCPGFLQ